MDIEETKLRELVQRFNSLVAHIDEGTWADLQYRYVFARTTKLKRNLLIRFLRRNGVSAKRILSLPELQSLKDEESIYHIESENAHRGYGLLEEKLNLVEESQE